MSHPGLIDEQDVATFLDAVRAGDTMTVAARKAGWSLNALRRKLDRDENLSERFADARATGTHARADQVDEAFDAWVQDPKCAPALRIVWGKRWNPGYREKVELVGAFTGPQTVKDDDWQLDMGKVMAGLAEAGLRVTIGPAGGEQDGPSGHVPRPQIQSAPAD